MNAANILASGDGPLNLSKPEGKSDAATVSLRLETLRSPVKSSALHHASHVHLVPPPAHNHRPSAGALGGHGASTPGCASNQVSSDLVSFAPQTSKSAISAENSRLYASALARISVPNAHAALDDGDDGRKETPVQPYDKVCLQNEFRDLVGFFSFWLIPFICKSQGSQHLYIHSSKTLGLRSD